MRLVDMGARVALVKGGHLGGEDSPDCLVALGEDLVWLDAGRIPGRHTHGTGCVLSAAIAAELARGMEPADACVAAKRFLERAIASGLDLGAGVGPVNPGWATQFSPLQATWARPAVGEVGGGHRGRTTRPAGEAQHTKPVAHQSSARSNRPKVAGPKRCQPGPVGSMPAGGAPSTDMAAPICCTDVRTVRTRPGPTDASGRPRGDWSGDRVAVAHDWCAGLRWRTAQAPRRVEVVLGARAADRRRGLAVEVHLHLALTPPVVLVEHAHADGGAEVAARAHQPARHDLEVFAW